MLLSVIRTFALDELSSNFKSTISRITLEPIRRTYKAPEVTVSLPLMPTVLKSMRSYDLLFYEIRPYAKYWITMTCVDAGV